MSFMNMLSSKIQMIAPEDALPGRAEAIKPAGGHFVTGRSLLPPYPTGLSVIHVGMGCFWGAERLFWKRDGVWVTAVGYGGGYTPNPTYNEVCTGQTGHAEIVRVVYDPHTISLSALLHLFWENHDPTQGMRQGNDMGTQYRSAIYLAETSALEQAKASREAYGRALAAAGYSAPITTEIVPLTHFYFAEEYHQQYLAKNPSGYCGIGGTGVSCPAGLGHTHP